MLDVSNLTRAYGDFVAVRDVSFTIGQGEIVGLLGHNGAGKTTIMKMLSGYLEPNEGRISLGGVDLVEDPKRAQRGLGYLPESLPIYPEMTVADYLDYGAELKGLCGEAKNAEIRDALQATEITGKLLSPIGTLSRGFKQRVGVAQALLGQPGLLIMDEPTNGLDPTQTQHMRELIRRIAEKSTVILSTHILQEVRAVCDRVLILRNGEMAVDERLADLQHSDQLLLTTSLAPQQATQLADDERVASVDTVPGAAGDGQHSYRLRLAAGAPAAETAADIARRVLGMDARLYALQPEQRDLETLFREVNEAGNSNAAQEDIGNAA